MSEDQFLILAPKSMVSSLFGDGTDSGGQENGGGVLLNNDITLHLGKGLLLQRTMFAYFATVKPSSLSSF